MLKTVVHVLGGTCVGKSTLMESMIEKFGTDIVCISVGKALRAKYLDARSPHFNPDKFDGMGSSPEMENEALSMYKKLVQMAMQTDAKLILVDGQPRTELQAKTIGSAGGGIHTIDNINPAPTPTQQMKQSAGGLKLTEQAEKKTVRFRQRFLFLHASDSVRRERLDARFGEPGKTKTGDDARGYDLGVSRMIKDDRDNLEVLIELGKVGTVIAFLDTSACELGEQGKSRLASYAPGVHELFIGEPE